MENLSFCPFTLPRKTCQGKTCHGELASVYSPRFFLDKGTCQGKLARVNEAESERKQVVRIAVASKEKHSQVRLQLPNQINVVP